MMDMKSFYFMQIFIFQPNALIYIFRISRISQLEIKLELSL